jgi:paired amphipathic helix protein Sin3a
MNTNCISRIDTPGVINRVSRLFHGNAKLIEGFNTFLPVGYRIEVPDPMNPNNITVTTPQGTLHNPGQTIPGFGTNLSQPFPVADPVLVGHASRPASRPMTPVRQHHILNTQPLPLAALDPASLYHANQQTNEAASLLGNLNNGAKSDNNGEFYHAIKYLNKIKASYEDENNTYKQFLDILQTYQKDQKNITDVRFFQFSIVLLLTFV